MFNHAYYGLSCNPFAKQSLKVKDSFLSSDHKEMMARLSYLKETRGIGVFTAPPGMGKSFSLRCFKETLNPSLYHMCYLCLSTISVSDFYRQFCELLGLEPKGSKTTMFKSIQERIFYLYKEKRCPLILAIDEAQYLSSSILRDLKMLMNYQYDSLNCFTLILSGEPYFNQTLGKSIHEALRQRITVHYDFAGLNPDEVTQYVHHKITVAGGAASIICADALTAVTGFCQGNPRMIDNLMTDALLLGSQLKMNTIDAEVIMSAANAGSLG
jgi:type II secretory pathway predicted ATPase ExeA